MDPDQLSFFLRPADLDLHSFQIRIYDQKVGGKVL